MNFDELIVKYDSMRKAGNKSGANQMLKAGATSGRYFAYTLSTTSELVRQSTTVLWTLSRKG